MISMALQVRSFFEEVIVEFPVQMLGLKIRHNQNAGNCSRELAETVIDVLCLKSDALLKLFAVNLGAASHLFSLFIISRSIRMERPPGSKLSLNNCINSLPHVSIVWRSMAFKDTRKAGWIWEAATAH